MTEQQRDTLERALKSLYDLEDVQRALSIASKLSAQHLETLQAAVLDVLAPSLDPSQ